MYVEGPRLCSVPCITPPVASTEVKTPQYQRFTWRPLATTGDASKVYIQHRNQRRNDVKLLQRLPQLSSSESPTPKADSVGFTAAPGFLPPVFAKLRDLPAVACMHKILRFVH